ncbi:MAG: folate family ECF transporter S component [Clostridia bacterium]|nr:folate family ECF transporter S component [Clostridia bacterium]
MNKVRVLVAVSLLISIEVMLTRFLAIEIPPSMPIVRIGFGFLPIALSAMLFGPAVGGITAAMADAIGVLLFSKGGMPFPGFTFSAALTGAVYGIFLHKKPFSVVRTIFAVLTILIVADLTLNTLWLTIITGKAAAALLPARLIKSAVMFPVQVILIQSLWRLAGSSISKRYVKEA